MSDYTNARVTFIKGVLVKILYDAVYQQHLHWTKPWLAGIYWSIVYFVCLHVGWIWIDDGIPVVYTMTNGTLMETSWIEDHSINLIRFLDVPKADVVYYQAAYFVLANILHIIIAITWFHLTRASKVGVTLQSVTMRQIEYHYTLFIMGFMPGIVLNIVYNEFMISLIPPVHIIS